MNRNSLPAKRSNWFDRIAGWIAQPAEGLIRRGTLPTVGPQSPDLFPARSQEEENIERWMGWIDDTVTNTVAGAIDYGKIAAVNLGWKGPGQGWEQFNFLTKSPDEVEDRQNAIFPRLESTLLGKRAVDEKNIWTELLGHPTDGPKYGERVYLNLNLEEIEKVFYKYGYAVPDIFGRILNERKGGRSTDEFGQVRDASGELVREGWDYENIIIDTGDMEGTRKKAYDLLDRGFERGDSKPYIDEEGRDTGLYIENWQRQKHPDIPWDTDPLGEMDGWELKAEIRESLRLGKPAENPAEMLGKMGLSLAASIPTAGWAAMVDPAIQAQGGLIQFDTDSDFEAVLNTLEFSSPAFTTIFGPADNYIVPIWRQWKASRAGLSGVFHSKRRAALNLKVFDPSADLEEIGESAIDTRQSLLDSGIPEKEADLSTRIMIQVGNNLKGEPTLFTDLININRVSDGVANSAFEESVRNPDMFVPQGYLFQVGDQEPRNILGFKHNFDDWIDWADAYGEGQITTWRRKTRDFDADALLKHLQDPSQRNVAVNPDFGRYSGMKLSSEELSSLGVYRFLEENSKKRVSIEDLRGYMDQNRIHISEVYMPDLYDSWSLSANLQGPVDRSGVMLLKLDLEGMDDNHPLIQELMPRWSVADPDDVPRNLQGEMAGHYSARYDAEFGSNVSEIRARFENLITGGVSEGKVPLSARQNMFMHARYQVRKDASGNLVFHIDEIQSDAFQKSMPYSDTDFANSIFDSILAPDNVNVPLFWQSKNIDGRQLPYHWMTGILTRNEKDRKGRMEYFDPSTGQLDSGEINIVDYFIAPANEAASTDDVVINQYQSIVNSLITDSNGLRDDSRILQAGVLPGSGMILPQRVQDSITRVRQAVGEGIEEWTKNPKEPTVRGMPTREIPSDFRAGIEVDPQLESMGMRMERQIPIDDVPIDDVQLEMALEAEADRSFGLWKEMQRRGVELTPDIRGQINAAQEALRKRGRGGSRVASDENSLLFDAIAEQHGGKSVSEVGDIMAHVTGKEFDVDTLMVDWDAMGSPERGIEANRIEGAIMSETRQLLFGITPDPVNIRFNKRRNPLNIREETHIIVAPDHEYGLGRNFSQGTIQVQVIDPVPGVAGGIGKAPVVRIAHNIPVASDAYYRESFLGSAIDKIFSRTGIFATRGRGVVGEPSRIRWSIDDVINNKVPGYRIKKYKDNGVEKYKIQEGMTESPVGIRTTGKRTVREWADGFETEKSAAIALLQYFNKAESNPYDFPLPPNFLFNITNFHKPVLRRMMFHGAGENAEFVTISTGDSLNNRYEGAALPYSDNNYGTASVNGMEAPNYIDADGNKVRRGKFVDDASQIITDIMRTAGWSGWTNKDSNMLIRATNLPSGTSLSSRKNVEDAVSAASRGGFLEPNGSLPVSIIPVLNDVDEIENYIPGAYAHSFRDKIARLGNNLGDMGAPWSSLEIVSGNFSVEKLRPGMWDEVIDDIDYRPYQVVPLSQDDAVLNALRNVTRQELEDQLNAAGDISLIADTLRDDLNHLIGSGGTIKYWESEIKELIYGISNLFEPSAVGGGGFRLPPGERGIRTINGLPAVRLPEIMSIPGKDELSILDFLEIEGLQSGHLPNGSSTSDILNALTELAVKVPGSDINTTVLDKSIGAKPLASLIDRPTDKVVPVHAIMLKDNLLDPAVRKKLGITAIPDDALTSRRSLQEALTEVQMRLFQANGDIPKGGKVLGFTDFTNDGRYLIRLTSAANFKTVMHEFAHVFRRHLSEDQLRIAGEFSMGKQQFGKLTNKNIWTRAGEEKFAEAFEEYLRVGAYPEGMQGVFERLKDMLLNVARAIKGTPHEEALSPAMRDLFDNLLNTKKTSTRQIRSALPNHMHPQAFKFYGHRVDNYTVADTGDIETGGRLFSTSDEPQVRPLVEELSSVSDIEDVLTANMIDNNYTNIMKTLPIVRNILKRIDPSAAATDPLTRGMIAHAMVSSEGLQKSQIAFSRLNRLGKQSDVFGDLDDKGLLMGDEVHPKLRGLTLNTVRTNVKYRPYLSPKQTEWVDTINGIEDGRLAMLKAEGIEVNELVFEEGGRYGGRTVMGKVFADGSTMATIVVGGEEGRLPTAKRGFEKNRVYSTAEEAIEDGFRYLEEDETVLRGLQGAYQRVSDKKFVDYIVKNVVWTRTSQAPDEITKRRAIADKRYDAAKNLLTQLQDAKRGKQIPWQTRKSIETILPEVEGMLDDVSQITLEQLIKAGRVAADQPIDATPRKGAVKALFNRVKELENEINTIKASGEEVPSELIRRLNQMKKDLGFTKFRVREAYKNFEETGTFEYNFERSALGILMEDKVGAIDKLLDIVRGTPYIKTLESGATITKHRGGLISDLGQESLKVNKEYKEALENARKVHALEGTAGAKIPALSGKIFTEKQPTNLGFIKDKGTGKMRPIVGQDVSEKIIRSLIEDTRGSEWLNTVNTYNSAMRFFQLAGDMSMIGIQLLFLTGHAVRHPSFLPRVIKAYVHAFIDPTVHAKILDNNRELLNNHPGMMLSASGTEFTDFPRVISDAGFVRAKPVQMIGEAASYVPGLPQTGRGYMRFLVGAQQGFEAALDTAGIELLKTIDHLAVDAKSTQEIDDFVNEFRGLANPSRLGITAKQRQVETLILLAPRYNRAIAAMMFDVVRGNIRGSQARKKLASSFAAISAMGVAFSLAQGEEPEDIVEHFKPHSPKFMTWDVGGANIGFGSKVRSLMKLTGNIYMQEDDNGNLPDASMWDILSSNPGFKFLRGNASPVIGSGIDFISGRTYMGEPLHGDQFLSLQTLERTAVNELLPMTMPIWASSVLLERGNAVQRATRGVSEFLGGRGYPESSYQIMQRFASDTLEIDYEDLEPFERKMLRDILVDVIGPIMAERVINGDKTAKYYSELDQLDKDRLARETQLLHQFMNHRQYPQFAGSGAARLLNTEFFRIQSEYAIYRQMLNEQYGMYQDDADYDADEVNKYIMQEWYKLYERAEDPKTGYFNADYLENLQNEFWKRKVPSDFDEAGTKFSNYQDYIYRNTSSTEHPKEFSFYLPKKTVARWERAKSLRAEFLANRGNWGKVLDNQQ